MIKRNNDNAIMVLIDRAMSEGMVITIVYQDNEKSSSEENIIPLCWITSSLFEARSPQDLPKKQYKVNNVVSVDGYKTTNRPSRTAIIEAKGTSNGSAQDDGELRKEENCLRKLEDILAEKELEINTIEGKIIAFNIKYMQIVGESLVKLDAIEAQIAELISLLHPSEEHIKKANDARKKAETSNQETDNAIRSPKSKTKFEPTKDIKSLYRKLAKMIHPDLGTSEMREIRNGLMAEANKAYQKGNIEALQAIFEESKYLQEDEETTYIQKRLSRVRQKIVQVNNRINQIEKEMIELKSSNLYKLMINVQIAKRKGEDLLNKMVEEVEASITERKKVLKNLWVQYKQKNEKRGTGSFAFDSNEEMRAEEILPNGYKRSEYYEQGFSDFDIDFWRLDQIGAPGPQAAGWILTDLMDGEFDGEIDFWPPGFS